MLGKMLSDETKRKISNAVSGLNNGMASSCIDNIEQICEKENLTYLSQEKQYVYLHCNACKTDFSFTKQMFNDSSDRSKEYCPTCFPRQSGTSKMEKEVADFIKSIYTGIVIPNDRRKLGGKEIDILIPELNLGIEFTGLYWHAEKQNNEKKHLLWKKQFAHTKGIQLITIFEDEWITKRKIVESRLAGLLRQHNVKIHGRKCTIVHVEAKKKNAFLERCHIQGRDVSKVNLGLEYEGNLVAIATFKKTNMVKGGRGLEWELSRFCSELNTRVIGGADKLIKYFRKLHQGTLISYADSRWSNGDLYKAIGFKFDSVTPPSYWYTSDYKTRAHRSNFMKHKLVEKFGASSDSTEWEIMQSLGYDRIWDCGTTKWILESDAVCESVS
jgi:hypothetical protein